MSILDKIKTTLGVTEPEKVPDFTFNRNKKILASTTMPTEVEIKKEEAEKSL